MAVYPLQFNVSYQKEKASRGREACLALDILVCSLGQNHPRPALRRAKKEAKEIAAIAAR